MVFMQSDRTGQRPVGELDVKVVIAQEGGGWTTIFEGCRALPYDCLHFNIFLIPCPYFIPNSIVLTLLSAEKIVCLYHI